MKYLRFDFYQQSHTDEKYRAHHVVVCTVFFQAIMGSVDGYQLAFSMRGCQPSAVKFWDDQPYRYEKHTHTQCWRLTKMDGTDGYSSSRR